MPQEEINSKYLKFIDQAQEVAKRIPRYFSKFSNKIFCNRQKIVLLVLKQKLRTTYDDLVELLKISQIPLYLGLKRIPHPTTLIKFAKRIKGMLSLALNIRTATNVAVDSTGFELESKSYYYRTIYNSDRRQKTKRYMKLSLSVDTDKLLILRQKIRKKFRNDNIDFRSTLDKLKVNYILADKGYDSRENRKFVFKNLKAVPQIAFRKTSGREGIYQSKAWKLFDKKRYNQRSKAETVFSIIKRRYGSVLKSKTDAAQKSELLCKLIAHNVDRLTKIYLSFLEGFRIARHRNIYKKHESFINIICFLRKELKRGVKIGLV